MPHSSSNPIQPTISAFGLNSTIPELRKIALRVEVALPEPRAGDYFAVSTPPPRPTLLQPASRAATPWHPEALFSTCDDLHQADLDDEWIEPHLCWVRKLSWGQAFTQTYNRVLTATPDQLTPLRVPVPELPAAAGALFYLLSLPPQSAFRKALFEQALLRPEGAYFVSEGLTLASERPAIVAALRNNTRFLFWTSRVPQFGPLCSQRALEECDLYAALTLILSENSDESTAWWCEKLVAAAFDKPEAASAALILFPNAPFTTRARWLWTLRQARAARGAYEVGRFGTMVGNAPLLDGLREIATSARFWCYWHRDVEPDRAQIVIDAHPKADLLWAAELLHACNLNDEAFRLRMREARAGDYGSSRAGLILQFLERRKAGGSGENR